MVSTASDISTIPIYVNHIFETLGEVDIRVREKSQFYFALSL